MDNSNLINRSIQLKEKDIDPMIYKITNKVNGKTYIGMTRFTMEKRFYQHVKSATNEYGDPPHSTYFTYLSKAIRKYGEENFTVDFLCEGLFSKEIEMIAMHKPEYNMTKGGPGGTGAPAGDSPIWRLALTRRKSMKGKNNPMYGKRGKDNPNFGKKRTPEQKEKSKRSEYILGIRIPVRVNNINYESVCDAARKLGRSQRYVRLNDELNEWTY